MVPHSSSWLYLYPVVYTLLLSDGVFLYNTTSGQEAYVSSSCSGFRILKELINPINMGVVFVDSKTIECAEVRAVLTQLREYDMIGFSKWQEDCLQKPVIFPPILSLQKDIEKAQEADCVDFVLDGILDYLSQISIILDLDDDNTQTYSAILSYISREWRYADRLGNPMSIDLLDKILEEVSSAALCSVELISSDCLFNYPQRHLVLEKLNALGKAVTLTAPVRQSLRESDLVLLLDSLPDGSTINLLMTKDLLAEFPKSVFKGKYIPERVSVTILIDDECQIDLFQENLNSAINTRLLPIYNGHNEGFFDRNIFISKEDLMEQPISMRQIFCNQKVNVNFFGKLICYPSGECFASPVAQSLGSLRTESVLGLIHKELIHNTSWRVTRGSEPCLECAYRYLCPPPTIYETLLGRPNLCHITQCNQNRI